MAKIDYWAIEEEIKYIIDSNLDGYQVEIEEDLMFAAEQSPWVGIYLVRRDPTEGQSIAAGTRLRYALQFSIYVWCFHFDKKEAVRQRDDALGELEVLFLANRTLNDKVDFVMVQGGELQSGRVEGDIGGFVSGGEIVLTAEAVAIV